MSIYTVTALVPTEDEGVIIELEILHYVDATTLYESIEITRQITKVAVDKIVSASLLTEKVWKRSDVRKEKGNA